QPAIDGRALGLHELAVRLAELAQLERALAALLLDDREPRQLVGPERSVLAQRRVRLDDRALLRRDGDQPVLGLVECEPRELVAAAGARPARDAARRRASAAGDASAL